jgi:hypothetical protein
MAFDSDLRNLIVATRKASPPIDDALEQQREKLRMKRKLAEVPESETSHRSSDEAQTAKPG